VRSTFSMRHAFWLMVCPSHELSVALRPSTLWFDLRYAISDCGRHALGREVAFNPLYPETGCAPNHPIFKEFPKHQALPLKGFVTDFVGTRTRYANDCRGPSEVPSRRFE
jgi:hypothetical protein